MRPYNPDTDHLPAAPSTDPLPEDPEVQLLNMKSEARDAAQELIPILFQKALNGKTRDALAIFEALSARSDFHSTQPTMANVPPVQILNISAPDVAGMLSGLRTITDVSGETK